MKKIAFALTLAIAPVCAAPALAATPSEVALTHVRIAQAMYSDALSGAITLQSAIHNLISAPSTTTLRAARAAWIAARIPYQQTEGFRFGNPVVDAWEGKVNGWPLDEGLIDYVAPSYGTTSDENPFYTANVIANPKLTINGKIIDASKITPQFLSETLQEVDGVEANIATGYHAIEFLLWGQDLNGTGPGAGDRPYTDYSTKNCTGGNCERRAQYLSAAVALLVSDLRDINTAWNRGGEARAHVLNDPAVGVESIILGLDSLSYGELAGERIKLGLLRHDPEEEHDCFSDNTHNSHYYDEVGMVAIYNGRYVRIDGSVVEGPSLADLLREKAPDVARKIDAAMANAQEKLTVMKRVADSRRMAYDQMIGNGNAEGNAIVQAVVDALVAQATAVEAAPAPLGFANQAPQGSDSLDNPSAVTK